MFRRSTLSLPLVLVTTMLLCRGLLLEHTALVDPTEARYASVAQEMVLSNNWVTPQLPMPEGVVPYLGKPPLHFWLTAISYKIFGMDEWSARLPSMLGAIIILLSVYIFASRAFDRETGILAALVTLSSAVFFYIAGASVVDVTLTACVSAAVVTLYFRIVAGSREWWLVPLAAMCGGLGFLTKGPIALVLIFLPFFIWGAFRRDLSWIWKTNWVPGLIVFLGTVAPWFIISEQANPGFIKYFIWNENIGRYLFRSYGDRYGSGHVHVRGMSWVMLALAFLPWTPILIWSAYRIGLKRGKELLRSNSVFLFTFGWAISAALFFTFVRQLHALYIIPSIPGMAILTVVLSKLVIENRQLPQTSSTQSDAQGAQLHVSIWTAVILTIVTTALLVFETVTDDPEVYTLPPLWIVACIAAIAGGYLFSREIERHMRGSPRLIGRISVVALIAYLCGIVLVSPYISQKKSAQGLVQKVAELELNSPEVPTIGIFTDNSFSHYWTARADDNETVRTVEVEYLPEDRIPTKTLEYVLSKRKHEPKNLRAHYQEISMSGPWILFKRRDLNPMPSN